MSKIDQNEAVELLAQQTITIQATDGVFISPLEQVYRSSRGGEVKSYWAGIKPNAASKYKADRTFLNRAKTEAFTTPYIEISLTDTNTSGKTSTTRSYYTYTINGDTLTLTKTANPIK